MLNCFNVQVIKNQTSVLSILQDARDHRFILPVIAAVAMIAPLNKTSGTDRDADLVEDTILQLACN